MPPRATGVPARLVERLSRASAADVAGLLSGVPGARRVAWAIELADEVPRRARADLAQGRMLALAATRLATASGDAEARGRALRAEGHALALGSEYRPALAAYSRAAALFARSGSAVQLAVTYSGTLQTLIYLGQYGRAHALAAKARRIFTQHGDRVRLARLESNVGNIYFRQDRFEQALTCYRRAEAEMRALGAHADAAVALRNTAVCLTSLNRFDQSMATYREARAYCAAHGLRLLVAEADYNIAYLHFLGGEYERALAAYAEARRLSEELGDRYHRTLCDLDEAEVCLDVNDHGGARRLAEQAVAGFAALGMRYERAKALVFLATAHARLGDGRAAQRVYARARALFRADANRPWVAAVDLASALALYGDGRDRAAARLAARAKRQALAPASRVLWDLLQARLALRANRPTAARAAARVAAARVRRVTAPGVEWQVHQVTGEAEEACGDLRAAERSYRRARRALERLRTQLTRDELKVSFLADKLAVYESLVRLALRNTHAGGGDAAAFRIIEEAKSRGLVDLLAFRTPELQARAQAAQAPAEAVRTWRQQVQAFERRIARESMRTSPDAAALRRLRAGASARARRLGAALAELRDADAGLAALHTGGTIDPDAIRRALPDGTTLLEYYVARGVVYGCVLAADRLRVLPLAAYADVARVLRLLRFQLAKFQLGPDHVRTFASVLAAATDRHLQELHALLMAPLRPLIGGSQIVIVPHGVLHYLPFHALHDGRRYLVDDYAVSYAPSGTVYQLCQQQPPSPHVRSLVVALADGYAPHIRREAEDVGQVLTGAQVLTGEQATAARVREAGREARYIHIATHGFFRRDNPMLSSVRLADGDLSLADLYSLTWAADLVTLSGCGTGLNAVVGGDELVGLMRGLLYAGARSLLLTMWQVDDFSTAEFMGRFYRQVVEGRSKSESVGSAMREVRERFPHPYYWAPFVLVGQSGPAGRVDETAR